MRTLISKFLFIISVITFYPSINLQASEAEPEFSISRITDVEKARSYHPLYKEYHQRVEIDEEGFINRISRNLSFTDSYYFWGIKDKEGNPIAFMDGAMFPSTYSDGFIMRLDSAHVFSIFLNDLKEEAHKIKFSEITNLFIRF